MRRFSAEYLEHTRRGMWDDDRDALADLALPSRERVLDVGCGTGELTRVLAAEANATGEATDAAGTDGEATDAAGEETRSDATVIGVDADPELLSVAREAEREAEAGARIDYLAGDATRLPVGDDAVDLAVCQALLINLPDPTAAVRELARVSADLVAAVEPDNGDVRVTSTVDAEERLEREAREAYVDGVDTDVALGDRVREAFGEAGLVDVRTRRYVHEKRTEPPYAEAALRSAARKASGAGLADHRDELVAATSEAAYDGLRERWREMGREVVDAIGAEEYERVEYVPFDVTVGRVE
ncbi:methyltransferase type 11 [Halorubrum californiense DSM 19288]|uniref:Methyltransferase type 11 n=1 Tax=Halorubrum californiense DSM 19288 TaxID=1227465 RepID=M0EJX9_9EURY|nr:MULTISPECIES: class I SAM-dependent methyltransferase [Halorubrum]ELZ48030.1 methyltransferase type 11 [Halorubrum californiense DSM 19288]TKX68207.1 class I SAM-dependent methyltransferase [Halorubrum sp. GN11GM_10-3_MGM]